MEPLETPVKDGLLYLQHVKFGKVRPWLPGSCPGLVGPENLASTLASWEGSGRVGGRSRAMDIVQFLARAA